MTPMARILIVEDDPLLAMAMEQSVEDLGHRVVGPTLNLHDGLAHARLDDLDFALLDFDLGRGADSIPIADELTRRGIPFVFTPCPAPATIRRSVPKAVVLGKPVGAADLAQALG